VLLLPEVMTKPLRDGDVAAVRTLGNRHQHGREALHHQQQARFPRVD
jgi:hypothetical protein